MQLSVLLVSCSSCWIIFCLHVDSSGDGNNALSEPRLGNEVLQNISSNNRSSSCIFHQSTNGTKPPTDTLIRIQNATYGHLILNYTVQPAPMGRLLNYTILPAVTGPPVLNHSTNPAVMGYLMLNHTTQPAATVWRLICAHDPDINSRGILAVLLMNMNTSIGDHIRIKSNQLQGCTSSYRGFVINKKSILVGYIPGLHTHGGELKLGYICIKPTMAVLARNLITRRRPLEYIQSEGLFERVAHLLRSEPQVLLTIGTTDPQLRHLIDLAGSSPRRRTPSESGSGGNLP